MRTPGRTRPSYCWPHAYRTPAPMPTASRTPRTNETPKRRASDRRRRGRCRGLAVGHGGREGQDRHGIDDGLVASVHGPRCDRRSAGAAADAERFAERHEGGQRGVGGGRCFAPDERRELGVAGRRARRRVWRRWQPGRLRTWAGRSSDAHARSAGAGPCPRQPRHSRPCGRICQATVGSAGATGTRDGPQTLRGRTTTPRFGGWRRPSGWCRRPAGRSVMAPEERQQGVVDTRRRPIAAS